MKIYQRFFCLLLFGSILAMAGGCSAQKSDREDGRLKVVATVYAEYDFLRNIAGDNIRLSMLLLPGADAHSFDPTPKDMVSVQEADLFVTIGGESDAWAEKILASTDQKVETIRLMDCVDELKEEEITEGMQTEEEHSETQEQKNGFDEHVWTSPENAMQIVQKLCDKLCIMDSRHAEEYQKNTAFYLKKLSELDKQFKNVIDGAKRREIIVADKFPFRYFADAYNLTYYAAFPGCSIQTDASAETIAFLIRKVKEDRIPVVFHMELSSEAMCNTICDETGAKKAQLNAVHNVSRLDFEKGTGYVELMQENITVLKEALNGSL